MTDDDALVKLKNLFENQNKYETDVFVKVTHALTVEAGVPAQDFLGQFIMTSNNTMLIPKIIEILGKCGGDNVIPYIVETMKTKSTPGIARETANTLRKRGTVKAKEALELLHEIKLDPVMKDLFKRQLEELVRENPIEYVWMPRLLLGKSMTSACTNAANSLARVAKEKAIPYLLREVLNPDLLIRTVIVSALGEIGSDIVVEKLFQVFKISYEESLKKDEHKKVIDDIKGKIPSGDGEKTIFELIDKNSDEKTKGMFKDFLAAYNSKAEDEIFDQFEELIKKGVSGITAHLLSLLKYMPYRGEEVFSKAIDYVKKEIDMESAEHVAIMNEILMSLGKILEKSRSKEAAIKDFLLSEAEKLEDEELKARAIEILGEIKGEDIVEKLKEFTKDKSWKIREKAVYSLGEGGNKATVDTLKKCCEDMHQDVSAAAMEALGKVDKHAVVELFESGNWRIRRLSLEVARAFNDPGVINDAKKLLDDDKYDVAFEAIETIGSIQNDESIEVLSALIKKDGPSRIQEKIIEKLEEIGNIAVLKNLVESLESEIPLPLFANVQRALLNVMTKADYDIEYDCVKRIKDICIAGMEKRDIKVKLNSVTLASEMRGLKKEDYDELIEHLKEYEKLKSSRNPQEKAIVMAADNSMSVLVKKKKELITLDENTARIKSLYNEISDKNEMRSQNAIAEIWGLFSKTELSQDNALKAEIWQHFSSRFLSEEASPRIKESLAKIFGDFIEPKAVPYLLKFKDSKIHALRLACEGALKKLNEAFSKEDIVSAATSTTANVTPSATPAAPQATATPEPQKEPEIQEDIEYKVLIIDSSLLIRNLYSKKLAELGFITDVAKSGAEALEKIKDDEYHVALLDFKLSALPGLEVLKKMPEVSKNPDIKVIIVSSFVDEENTKEALSNGASAVLAKPVNMDTLATKIKVVMR